MEQAEQGKKGKNQHVHKPRSFTNSRGSGYSNRNQRHIFSDRHSRSDNGSVLTDSSLPENFVSNADLNVQEGHSSVSVNFSSGHNYTKHQKGRQRYDFPRHTKHTNDQLREDDHTNYVLNSRGQGSADSTCLDFENEQIVSRRGKIIGGRYIRKHSNQSVTDSHSFNNENSSTSEHSLSNQLSSKSYDNKMCNSESSQEYPLNLNQKRNMPCRTGYNFDHSRRKPQFSTQNNNKKFNESSTDIYRYSSPSASYNGPSNSEKEFVSNKISKSKTVTNKDSNATQRELLMYRLTKGECECLVCCEPIRVKDQIWHCLSCYHVFHLRCIRKWARSPAAVVEDGGWRCPACQSITPKVPYDYYCFCEKHRNPDVNYHLTPHSCGEICGRKRPKCSHLCNELCHPGPCPPCLVVVKKNCACGKTSKTVLCNHTTEETCHSVCEKILNCGLHRCQNICHPGDCSLCEVDVHQKCFCGKSEQTVPCTLETAAFSNYSCGNQCGKDLSCSHHVCTAVCHPGSCKPCNLSSEVIKTCACGKSSIEELVASGKTTERKSCKDAIPLCGEVCGKTLFCGPKDNPHTCQSLCHEGECPPCSLTTSSKCRCGAFTKEFQCTDITPSFVFLCEKRCNRRKDCGRHKCLNNCCVNIEHKCELICNKKLTCGNHLCQETCHMAKCPTCYNVSFDELRCYCGSAVLYPPVHCGTKPPECTQPCTRTHSCDHEVKHFCHSEETCPPCTSLTSKWCFGHHKQLGSVMCFLDGLSCGMPCLKPISCGNHKCQLACHSGPCLKDGAKCTQTCTIPRPSCGHPCGNSCHDGPCPETPCRAQVTLKCPCGHRSETTSCYDSTKSYHLMSATVLASKMQEIKEGQSVNLSDMLGRKSKNNKLQCSEECARIERNKRIAVALQIQNPDLSCSPGPPSYSEFLKEEAKKNPHFVSDVYYKISDLVKTAKESKRNCRSHSFPPMNREQRRVVNELAEFFGCDMQSYDEEPKRNVVVTAYKAKSWLPFVSIMTVVERDMGLRKGPAPVLVQRESKNFTNTTVVPAANPKKKIDYFDFNE